MFIEKQEESLVSTLFLGTTIFKRNQKLDPKMIITANHRAEPHGYSAFSPLSVVPSAGMAYLWRLSVHWLFFWTLFLPGSLLFSTHTGCSQPVKFCGFDNEKTGSFSEIHTRPSSKGLP